MYHRFIHSTIIWLILQNRESSTYLDIQLIETFRAILLTLQIPLRRLNLPKLNQRGFFKWSATGGGNIS